MFPLAHPTPAPRASPASQISASAQYVLSDGSPPIRFTSSFPPLAFQKPKPFLFPPIRFRPSFLAASVAAGSAADEFHEGGGDWDEDGLTLTELSFRRLRYEPPAPPQKLAMGKRIVVASHAQGHSVMQEMLPGLLEGRKARWVQKEAQSRDKHPVGVGLNWSQVLEERTKPKASYFDSDCGVAPLPKTLSPSMVQCSRCSKRCWLQLDALCDDLCSGSDVRAE